MDQDCLPDSTTGDLEYIEIPGESYREIASPYSATYREVTSPCSTTYRSESVETNYGFREDDTDIDEETEDASEVDTEESVKYSNIKEQIYEEQLARLKRELRQLRNGTHAGYLEQVRRLEAQKRERLHLNMVNADYLNTLVERDYIIATKAAANEFKEKKAELMKSVVAELEEKRTHAQAEFETMEMAAGYAVLKPFTRSNLRRKHNHSPYDGADRKAMPSVARLNFLASDEQIEADLKAIREPFVASSAQS